MENLLTGYVFWSYDFEINQQEPVHRLLTHVSGMTPLHSHQGEIILTYKGLTIIGDVNLHINSNEFEQLYLGFDDIFTRAMVKNFGLFWQPLRITFNKGYHRQTIYLIIDYKMFIAKGNKLWFNTLQQVLS
jgi:hypothetical protein